MAYLTLTLLGGFEVALAPGRQLSLSCRKAQALLAYCALQPGHAHSREKLATLLWGETEEDHARNSLRQALFILRTVFDGALARALRIEGDTVGLDPGAVDVDVALFERFAGERTPKALGEAAALYRGDLLDGFSVNEEPFEEWMSAERERLRELALEVFARLLRHQGTEGMTDAATQTAWRLLTIDPLQEVIHRALMRLHAQAGRRDAALRQYELCAQLLRRELRVEPEAETRELYEEIARGRRFDPRGSRVAVGTQGAIILMDEAR